MSQPEFLLRRATVDDLNGLKQLWERSRLQVLDLEKRLTEFQIIATPEGDLLGAIGLQIHGKEGRMHSEAFADAGREEEIREQLWERVQNVARNNGLVRIWTLEPSPFWRQSGFQEPADDIRKKFPAAFGDEQGKWQVSQLREESEKAVSLEQEFEMFQQAQRASTEKIFAQARMLKVVATILALAVSALVIVAAIFYTQRAQQRGGSSPPQSPAPSEQAIP